MPRLFYISEVSKHACLNLNCSGLFLIRGLGLGIPCFLAFVYVRVVFMCVQTGGKPFVPVEPRFSVKPAPNHLTRRRNSIWAPRLMAVGRVPRPDDGWADTANLSPKGHRQKAPIHESMQLSVAISFKMNHARLMP